MSIIHKGPEYTKFVYEYSRNTQHYKASTRLSYSDTQVPARVLLMSTQNPRVLMSTRGIF